ncbi:MAG: recombination mediator RecR [Candidatus Paceibacterota bacterium]|nr:recombination mediator RecR [Candidatus Paceibacterota bacterium]
MDHPIQKLIEAFSKFPGTGTRVAGRFARYIIKMENREFDVFLENLSEARKKVKICSFCFDMFEGEKEDSFCPICLDKTRSKDVLCIVEKESDLEAIEKIKKYKGLYFILGGTVSLSFKKENKLRIEELKSRIEKLKSLKEIIIATNFTAEGEATGLYIERIIKELSPSLKITRLSRGMPIGGELEYADSETIEGALLGRK